MGHHGIDLTVGAVRVMMKKSQSSHLCPQGQRQYGLVGGMPPALMFRVFRIQEMGVVKKQIRLACKRRKDVKQTLTVGHLIIRQKYKCTAVFRKSVTKTVMGMLDADGFNENRANFKRQARHVTKKDLCGDVIKSKRETGRRHDFAKIGAHIATIDIGIKDIYSGLLAVQRLKKGKADNMVPMHMGKQQVELPALFGHQVCTQTAQAGSGIDYNRMAAGRTNLQTGGIPPITNVLAA